MAPFSQELEPPRFPGRFNLALGQRQVDLYFDDLHGPRDAGALELQSAPLPPDPPVEVDIFKDGFDINIHIISSFNMIYAIFKPFYIIIIPCYMMSAAKVDPFYTVGLHQKAEFFFNNILS